MANHTTRRTAVKVLGGALGATVLGAGTAAGEEEDDDAPDSGNRAVGGGEEYNRKIPPSEADYMISDASELRPVLENEAEAGDVVYVDPDATLVVSDLGYDYADNIPVPAGVTLASNRGIDGADGGHIKNELNTWPTLDIEEGVRVTGLRLSGPNWDWIEYGDVPSSMGIRAVGPDTEIDNCELWGFSHAAVGKGHPSFYGNFPLTVRNNYIHHNPMDGLGYGVTSSYSSHDLIEYNLFANNRHSVNGGGSGGYTARFNHVVGEAISHVFDMHQPGGTRIHIHHNTVEPVENVYPGRDRLVPGVTIRRIPEDEAWIHHNWIHNPEAPKEDPEVGDEFRAITQIADPPNWDHVEEWQNVRFHKNHFGEEPPETSDIGAPSSHGD